MKRTWIRSKLDKLMLRSVLVVGDDGLYQEGYLKSVQKWCEENNCGTRMAFDMFHFETEEEMVTFLLRWS